MNAALERLAGDVRRWWQATQRQRLLNQIAQRKASDRARIQRLAGCEFPQKRPTR